MKTLAQVLADFAVGTRTHDIAPLALERAKMSLASTIASAAMGQDIESARIIRDVVLTEGGASQASVWFHEEKLPLAAAARINAVASDAAASDDSDLRSIAHIGTIISTAAVALGEYTGRPGRDILGAMVLGYEVAGRIDESLTPGRMQRGFHGSVSTVFSAAVASGRLLGLDAGRMAHAIALAATSIGGMAVAADSSCAREYHAGNAVMAGIQAAMAAEHGFEADLAVLETPRGFLSAMGAQAVDDITRDMGRDWDIVTDMAIKLMPGAHPFHATAEAAADAARAGQVRPEDIDRVVISAAVQWTSFKGKPHPRNLVDAAHSLVYFVAVSIVHGQFGWDAMTLDSMTDPIVARVQDKVVFDSHPSPLPDRFPHRHGGGVTIVLNDGREFSSYCTAPRGSGPRDVSWDDVEAKFRRLVSMASLPHDRIEESLKQLRDFDGLARVDAFIRLLVVKP